jgi:predicted nucleotidyltransferase
LIEGDYIQIEKGVIFDVKGLVHTPQKVIAFPRFLPDSGGDRKRGNICYRKIYSISERFEFLQQNLPEFIVHDPVFDEKLCEVPLEDVKRHYRPVNRLEELRHSGDLDALERNALEFMELLKSDAKTPWNALGISGSLLVKLHTPNSDIDPIIYGTENSRKVYEALGSSMQNSKSNVKTYRAEELLKLYDFRLQDTQASFKDFIRTERRKVLQGKFGTTDYFARFVKNWNEIHEKYGDICYKNVGYAKIKAAIEDDSEAIFTPCSYKLQNISVLEGSRFPIEEISSFRGRFCDQARNGETVIAQGKVESVTDNKENREYFRLLLGNKSSDYMILA